MSRDGPIWCVRQTGTSAQEGYKLAERTPRARTSPGETPGVDAALKKLIKDLEVGGQFALPGVLCAPAFGSAEHNGPAMRVLLALMWLSSNTLKRGGIARFQASLTDLRHAAGFSRYKGNAPVKAALAAISNTECKFIDGGDVPVFAEFEQMRYKDVELVEWSFHPEFASVFDNPGRFALIDITHLAQLTKGIDLFLYRQAMLVRNMRKPVFRMPASELYRVTGIDEGKPFKRVVERVRRSLSRVSTVAGLEVSITPIFERGSRALAGLEFTVETQEA